MNSANGHHRQRGLPSVKDKRSGNREDAQLAHYPAPTMKAFCVSLFLLFASTGISAQPVATVEVGQTLRDAPLPALSGPASRFNDYRGKPLLINVWASWCGPCRAEMASLDRLSRRFPSQLKVIGISTDDYPEKASAFLKKANTAFPHYLDGKPFPLETQLGANRIPLTVLIDAEGRVIAKSYGAREWDSPEAVEAIGKALKVKLGG
ncbi:MAG: hypothetical protein RIR00_404 [Pseudomonadota bacterium]|jgi:thiol-disulfide isomerase/thioredoxin